MTANLKRKKIVFLVGTSFSGSTIIGGSIHNPETSFLSEVDRFAPFKRHDDNYLINECTTCHSNHIGESCPIFGNKRLQAVSNQNNLISQYLELISPCGEIIIDGSKTVDWIANLVDAGLMNTCDVYCALVSRNPIAYSFSASTALNEPIWVSAISWRETYAHALRVLIHRGIPFLSIRYESIFTQTSANTLSNRLTQLIGEKIDFRLESSISSAHCLGGNLGGYLNNEKFNRDTFNGLTEFNPSETWKFDFYNNEKIKESKRWTEIGYQNACSIINIPGIVDTMNILGFTIESIIKYFD